MKKTNIFKLMVIVFAAFLVISACKKDEGFTQVSAFERGINNALNDYRATKGIAAMNLQFLLMNDAKDYSAKMANETVAFGIEGIMPELENQKVLLSADSSAAWVAYSKVENADSVLNIILKDPEAKRKIEGYFNQSAVGTAKDVNGNWYITGLLLHFK